MENKKRIIIVVSILLAYFIIMMIFFGFDSLKKKVYHIDFIIAPNSYLRYEKGTWSDMKEKNKLLGKTYKIYENHQFLYDGTLQYTDNKWYGFDQNNKPIPSFSENFFAYRGNMKINVVNYKTMNMSETEIKEVSPILQKHKITFEPEFTKTLKVELDFNNDKEIESIYIISNALGMEEQSLYFSIAYMKIRGKIEVLIEDVSEDAYKVPSLNLKEILDINNDKKYELIFEKIYFDQIGTCHEIFEYEKNSYQSVKTCELINRGDDEE